MWQCPGMKSKAILSPEWDAVAKSAIRNSQQYTAVVLTRQEKYL
jgi:hypothetical protein